MIEEINICKNCKREYTGNFCNYCGEKKILDSDFSTKHIISQAFSAITNFDSKFVKTFKQLFKNPGSLSKKYITGIRVPYLKPFQIFIICNIIFFVFLSDTDLFRSPSKWFFNQNFDFYGMNVMAEVENITRKKNINLEEIKFKYDRISSDLSKSMLILLIPFISLVGVLINKKLRFGKHLIFSTHFFSLLLLFTTILYLITTNLPLPNKWFFIFPVTLLSLIYYIKSISTFYEKSTLFSIIYGLVGLLFIAIFISFYRDFINIVSFKLIAI